MKEILWKHLCLGFLWLILPVFLQNSRIDLEISIFLAVLNSRTVASIVACDIA